MSFGRMQRRGYAPKNWVAYELVAGGTTQDTAAQIPDDADIVIVTALPTGNNAAVRLPKPKDIGKRIVIELAPGLSAGLALQVFPYMSDAFLGNGASNSSVSIITTNSEALEVICTSIRNIMTANVGGCRWNAHYRASAYASFSLDFSQQMRVRSTATIDGTTAANGGLSVRGGFTSIIQIQNQVVFGGF